MALSAMTIECERFIYLFIYLIIIVRYFSPPSVNFNHKTFLLNIGPSANTPSTEGPSTNTPGTESPDYGK